MKSVPLSASIVLATAWLGVATSPAAAQRTCTITVDGTARSNGEYTVATEMGLPNCGWRWRRWRRCTREDEVGCAVLRGLVPPRALTEHGQAWRRCGP